jgi:hypothetical protein
MQACSSIFDEPAFQYEQLFYPDMSSIELVPMYAKYNARRQRENNELADWSRQIIANLIVVGFVILICLAIVFVVKVKTLINDYVTNLDARHEYVVARTTASNNNMDKIKWDRLKTNVDKSDWDALKLLLAAASSIVDEKTMD